MQIALFSDLHLECLRASWAPQPLEVDMVILAGDISLGTYGMQWAVKTFSAWPSAPAVIYVCGNHEFYEGSLRLIEELQQPVWARQGITFLEQGTVEFPGVRILGCTLWSGFDLYGAGAQQALAMATARANINDYWMIQGHSGKRLEPRNTLALFKRSLKWLESKLCKPFEGKTIVVTHFAPHRRCVAPQHEGSEVSPYFVTDPSRLMADHSIALWCHGHTHTNNDFLTERAVGWFPISGAIPMRSAPAVFAKTW